MTVSGKRRILWGIGVFVALLLLLPIGLWLALNSDAVQQRVVERVQTTASQRLGREVTIGDVDADFFPSIALVLRDFKVAGGAGEPAFVEARATRVNLALWPLLRSFGNDVRIDAFTLESPELSLVKRRDDTWSHEEVSQSLERSGGSEGETDFLVSRAEIEDGTVRFIDRTSSPETVIVLQGIHAEAQDIAYDQPLELQGTAAIGGSESNVEASVRLDRLPRSWDRPEDWPQVTAHVEGDDLPLGAFRSMLPAKLGTMARGGAIDFVTDVKTAEDGAYAVSGRVDVDAVQLRTGEGKAGFSFATRYVPGGSERMEVALSGLNLEGPGMKLGGEATLTTAPTTLRFALAGPLLNLDTVMDALPPEPEGEAGKDANEPLVSEPMRAKLAAAEVSGTLKLDTVQSGKLEAKNLDAAASLTGGTLTLQKATASVYGGTADLKGTTLALTEEIPRWTLKAALNGLQLGTAMASLVGNEPVEGKLGGTLELQGQGNDWKAIRDEVTGGGKLILQDGALAANLRQGLSGAIASGLQKVGKGGLAGKAQAAGRSELDRVEGAFRVQNGWLVLSSPLTVKSPVGEFTLGGRIGLSRALDLEGSVTVPPTFIAQLTQNRWKPAQPVVLPLAVAGTLEKPVLTAREPGALLEQLVTGEAKGRGEKLKREAEERVRDELKRRTRGLPGF